MNPYLRPISSIKWTVFNKQNVGQLLSVEIVSEKRNPVVIVLRWGGLAKLDQLVRFCRHHDQRKLLLIMITNCSSHYLETSSINKRNIESYFANKSRHGINISIKYKLFMRSSESEQNYMSSLDVKTMFLKSHQCVTIHT